MSSSGPALVGVVKRDWSSLSSIAISWTEVEQPPADILDYEVKYYEKVLTASSSASSLSNATALFFNAIVLLYPKSPVWDQ
jgi:hypothetical protein